MADIRRPNPRSSGRGFYLSLKMRLIRPAEGRLFCHRCFKWVLWFSLSFYFFASFLFSHEPAAATISTAASVHHQSEASRALIDSENTRRGKLGSGAFEGLKIYIYDLPARFNIDWLKNERCGRHLFASEVAIHRALETSDDVRTFDPWEADFFFVPVYVSCNFSSVNGFPAIGHARSLMSAAVSLVSSEHPFWNRSGGADHVFVASHDFGSCFHTLEDRAVSDGVPEFLKNSVILQTFGVKYNHPCQDVEHVVIPPYVSPESVRSTLTATAMSDGRREIFAFFRGKMEVRPKNVSGRFYGKRVRTAILQKYGNDRKFYLRRHSFAGYQSEILRSTFCLCPLGWAPWSPRLVESVVLGCVPVIIADGIRLPFPSAVPWEEISVTVREKDVQKLRPILEKVAATNLTNIQRRLMDPSVRRALLYNVPMVEGDATWQVLRALTDRLSPSHRRVTT
ncbi:unnamed protein product [Cuscuta campestris]|uniref:Exostosin GT47 domain-containing protein n=1 Tax=Cuscuta campestris TaxID=132261 RepID=A0A484KEP1_9ASTE|nr:unnamed protein product [Cuscuta campestris]